MYLMDLKEISIVEALQSLRTPLLDKIFLTINIFDHIWLYFVFVILIWYFKSEKAGFHLLYLQIIDTVLYSDLKFIFELPRPYQIDPSLKILGTTGYGFPSGAASAIVTSFGFIFFILKPTRTIFKICAIIMMLLVGIARVYLGAHFPTDVIGGYVLGALIILIYSRTINFFERLMHSYSPLHQLLIHNLFIIALFAVYPNKHSFLFLSSLLGAVVWHIIFDDHKHHIKNMYARFTALLLALAGSFSLYIAAVSVIHYQPAIIGQMLCCLLFFLMGSWIGASGNVVSHIYRK